MYTVGTEIGGTLGNYSAASVAGGYVEFNGQMRNPQSANRVRGLTSADFTRNFYLTSIPFDSYNTQRVDINRGSNSILFGLGSPAGIINSQPIQPTFRRAGAAGVTSRSMSSIASGCDRPWWRTSERQVSNASACPIAARTRRRRAPRSPRPRNSASTAGPNQAANACIEGASAGTSATSRVVFSSMYSPRSYQL